MWKKNARMTRVTKRKNNKINQHVNHVFRLRLLQSLRERRS